MELKKPAKHSTAGNAACPSCEEKLLNAHPTLCAWFREKVKLAMPDCHISWSYRDEEAQERAFLDGKTLLHFPLSAHNKTDDQGNPCALALDLFRLQDAGASWPWKYFKAIAELDNVTVLWGGTWTHLGDGDHFELVVKRHSIEGGAGKTG